MGFAFKSPPGLPALADNDPYRQGSPLEVGVFVERTAPWEHLVPKGFLLVMVPFGRERFFLEDRAMPRILVALDDSCGSEKALEAAVKLAQQDGGRLTAVTVLEQTGNPALDQLTEDVKARSQERAWRNCLQTAANYARSRGVRLTPILREGHAGRRRSSVAPRKKRPTLLVLGASSRAERRPRARRHCRSGEQPLSVYRADCA